MAWIARLAVRRVVWIVVGLVVFAALGAAGVKAASQSLDFAAASTGSTADAWVDVPGTTVDAFGGTAIALTATYTQSASADGGFRIWCGAQVGGNTYTGFVGAGTKNHATGGIVPGTGTVACKVQGYWGGSTSYYTITAGSLTYDDGEAAQGFSCDPACVVELGGDDRTMIVYGFGLVIALGTAGVVVTGLRRN